VLAINILAADNEIVGSNRLAAIGFGAFGTLAD
jgi:hypothetical protein